MDGFWITAAIHAIRILLYAYDFISFPIYFIVQRPWEKRKYANINRAKIVSRDKRSIVYRSTLSPHSLHVLLEKQNVTTVNELLTWASNAYSNKKCLGTRQILAEEIVIHSNGSVNKKYKLGEYTWFTYAETEKMVGSFGRGLRDLNMTTHKNVAIFAETRAEWLIAAHGCFKQNLTIVTIYATLGEDGIIHAINETEVDTVITSHDLLPKFKKMLAKMPEVKNIVYMEDQLRPTDVDGFKEDVTLHSFGHVLKTGLSSTTPHVLPNPDDVAIIMYTSGSTGVPKGVIITHKNVLASVKSFSDLEPMLPTDTFLAFLPLAHVFELLAESVCIANGIPIGYSSALTMVDSGGKVQKGSKGDATVLQPTVCVVVPLILDRIAKGISEKVKQSGPFKEAVFKFAYDYKEKWYQRGYDTPLLDKLVFTSARQLLGGRVRTAISGGAPLTPDSQMKVKLCLSVSVIQGYGLTETCSSATGMDKYDTSIGRVGQPLAVCDIKLENWEEGGYLVSDRPCPRGEIIIGGDNVSPGYYKLSDKTKEDFFEQDGKKWFRTGDVGEMYPDGTLKIIDRKKDLVKLQLGEYVSLGKVEAELKTCPLVENICVYADSTKTYTVALVVPNRDHLVEIAARLNLPTDSLEDICNDENLEKEVLTILITHSKKCKLAKFEIPGAVKICLEQWSPDMGLVTAAFKLKRKAVQERYQNEINQMYASGFI